VPAGSARGFVAESLIVMQKIVRNPEAVIVRVEAKTKAELVALAHEHGHAVTAELRQALEHWLDTHRRELLDAWASEEALTR
jgi:hypothetical protein